MAWYVKNVERSQKWESVGNLWNAKVSLQMQE